MADTSYTPRLKTLYTQSIREKLTKQFNYSNGLQIPSLDKVVINMGLGSEGVTDQKKVTAAANDLTLIAGQKSVADALTQSQEYAQDVGKTYQEKP